MKIIHNDICKKKKSGALSLILECPDDVYELNKILTPNDKFKCFTHRKLSVDGRNQQKIGLTLTLRMESYTADLDNGILYIKGKVCEENEYVKLGLYHTLEIELDKKFVLYKEKWSNSDMKVIVEAVKPKKEILVYIIYEKDTVVSLVGNSRIKVINKLEYKNKRYNTLLPPIINYIDKVETIVICSVTSDCSDFYNFIEKNVNLIKKNQKINLKEKFCIVKLDNEFKNSTNKKVINYILVGGPISKRLNSVRYINDLKELSAYFLLFEKGEYDLLAGKIEIKEALQYGALEKVFMIDEIYRPSSIEKRKKIEEFCDELNNYRVKTFIIPVSHHLGEKLKEIGGMCGILKYNYREYN